MAIIYSDTEKGNGKGFGIDISKVNPNNAAKKHIANWYYLKFILSKGTTIEKIQASKELVICERKIQFWYKQPTFSIEQAIRDTKTIQAQWSSTETPRALEK
jgi:hypothetical protein